LGRVCIILFSIIGVYAQAKGMQGQAAVEVGKAFGVFILLVINFIMITFCSIKPVDSTFFVFSKLAAIDLKLGNSLKIWSLVYGRYCCFRYPFLFFLNAEIFISNNH